MGKNKAADGFRDFSGRRWLIVALRAAHLVGLVGTGASLLSGLPLSAQPPFLLTLIASGVATMALDLRAAPGYLLEAAGSAMLIKLGLLLWMAVDPARQLPLFWFILVFSAIIAHAPARLRHWRIPSRRQD